LNFRIDMRVQLSLVQASRRIFSAARLSDKSLCSYILLVTPAAAQQKGAGI
jgi:hypothetical protein